MEGDHRSFRIAITEDRYVNPSVGGLDALAVLSASGWGVIQLPEASYPTSLKASMLIDVAEQSEEFWRRGYDVVLVGEQPGLVDALAAVGMPCPDQVVPADAEELAAFLRARPVPKASQLLPTPPATSWAEEDPRSERC